MSKQMSKEMRSILLRCEDHLSEYMESLDGLDFQGKRMDELDKLTDEICLILHGKENV